MKRFYLFATIFPVFLLSCNHGGFYVSPGGGYVPPTPLAGLGGAVVAASRYQHDHSRHIVKKIIKDVREMLSEVTADLNKIKFLAEIAVLEAKIGNIEASNNTFQDALDMADSSKIRQIALSEIALAQKRLGDTESYKRTVEMFSHPPAEKFKERSDNPAQEESKVSITDSITEIESIAAEGKIEDAKEGVKKLPEEFRPTTLYYIVEAQADKGDIKGTLETAYTITKEYGYQARALESIVSVQIERGDEVGAYHTINNIEDVEGAQFRADAFWRIATTLSDKGNKAGAAKAILEGFELTSQRPYIPSLPYSKISALLLQATNEFHGGKKQAAGETLKKALLQAKEINGMSGRRWALTEVIITKALTGDVNGAVESQKIYLTDDDPFTDLSLPFIAKGYLDSGNTEKAVQTVDLLVKHTAFDIHDPFSAKSALLLYISVALARAGDLENALNSIGQVQGGFFTSSKWEALSIIATAKGFDYLDPTLAWAHRLDTPYDKAPALLAIAEGVLVEFQGTK